MTPEQAKKSVLAWFRALALILLLGIPAYLFLKAGRQIDVNANLFAAISENNANKVGFLLDSGANANGHSPQDDKRPMVRKVLDSMRGLPEPTGRSPLEIYFASHKPKNMSHIDRGSAENVPMLQALLDHHANANVTDSYLHQSPLHYAAQYYQTESLRLLLKHGAQIEKRDLYGMTALHYAVQVGDVASATLLLDSGADINTRNQDQTTPLITAASMKNAAMVKLLIARGADVNARDARGDTALALAQRQKLPGIVALLKAAGAK